MNEKNNGRKSESALLNTYSIQEITAIFSEIDEKILSLHSCSSDDFLTLNSYFKKYYADSKTISSNATNLFNLFTSEDLQKEFFEQLHRFQMSLQTLLISYDSFQNKIVTALDSMLLEMEQMFVTANNLKQDLMTLKLLVTNLKIDVTVFGTFTDRMVKKTNDFSELIIQTKSFFVEFYKYTIQFKDLIKTISVKLSRTRDKNIQNLNELINEINFSTGLLNQTFIEAKQLVPQLSQSTESTSSSIAKIITNLQYQDIIRQKIDHIQQTHQEILKQISHIKSEDEEISIQKKLDFFIQIRDIAGLQAAQLIHANKEYQKAIESISGKFLEVGHEMTQIASLCHQITGKNNVAKNSHFDEIKDKFEKTGYFSDLIQKSIDLTTEKIKVQQDGLSEIINNYADLSDFFTTIDKSISKSINNQSLITVEHFESTTNQIKNILAEIQSINGLYNSQFNKIQIISNSLNEINTSSTNGISDLNKKLGLFNEEYQKLNGILNNTNENVYKILDENQALSNQISLDIKTSIEQIKYYDYFDKVIEEIISKLNDINQKLQSDDEPSDKEIKDKLDYLKTRYTMESEHVIHNKLTDKENLDLSHLESTGVDEEDDNLELF